MPGDTANHLSFQKLVIELSTDLLDVGAHQVDQRILHVLESIGEFVGADRSYVFRMRDERLADNTHEWCSAYASPQAHRLQGLDIDVDLPWFAGFMRRFEVFHVPRVRDLPDEAQAERREFEAESIRSLVVVPMVHAGALTGFLGFDAVREERDWSADDVAVLRIVGQMLTAVLQRARFEQDLARSEDRFRSLVEHTSDWVWEVDTAGVYTYVSPTVRSLLGWEPEQLLGRSAFDLMPPEESERVRAIFARHVADRAALRGVVNHLRHRDGRDVWVETNGVPVLDEQGELKGYRGIDRDITARRQAELERRALDERMREAQRFESLGVLAGGIAHDFNNLLTAVLGQATLAASMLPAGHDAQRCLRVVQDAAQRASELTRQLLAYSGRATVVRGVVDLSTMAREMGPLLEASTSTRGLLSWDLDPVPRLVEGDVSQFRQIVLNLVINACDAVRGREHASVVIATGATTLDMASLDQSFFDPDMAGRLVAWLEVRDDGPGIRPEVLPRIFDPFFSTKSSSRGLGLSAVLGIVRGHRGGLRVVSSATSGSAFRVFLPLADAQVQETRPPSPVAPVASSRGCVLVIDDDDLVRSAAVAMLAMHGYAVLEAAGGIEGVREYEAHRDEVDVVVLDMTMPGLDGAQVAERLRALSPDVRILAASGYPAAETAERMAAQPPAGYLEKPFSSRTLLEAVGKLVQGGPAQGAVDHACS